MRHEKSIFEVISENQCQRSVELPLTLFTNLNLSLLRQPDSNVQSSACGSNAVAHYTTKTVAKWKFYNRAYFHNVLFHISKKDFDEIVQ